MTGENEEKYTWIKNRLKTNWKNWVKAAKKFKDDKTFKKRDRKKVRFNIPEAKMYHLPSPTSTWSQCFDA